VKKGRKIPASLTIVIPAAAFIFMLKGMGWAQNTPVAINGPLHVSGIHLCNQYDRPIRLRGMSSHGIQWFDSCITDESFDWLANTMKADIFRIAVYMQENGWLTDKNKYNRLVNDIVDMAGERGMYAIIDCHILTPGDPMFNIDNAVEFFDYMASAHKNKNHVIYELCNEPNGDDVTWQRVKEYADSVISVIRKHDKRNLILAGSPQWSSLGGQAWTEIRDNPIKDENLMYSYHFYAGVHKEDYRQVFKDASDVLPLFVSEFGMMDMENVADWGSSELWMDLLDEKNVSWVNWSFSDLNVPASAILKHGTCPDGPFDTAALSEAGEWIYKRMSTPDHFEIAAVKPGVFGMNGAAKPAGLTLAESYKEWRITCGSLGCFQVVVRDVAGKTLAVSQTGENGICILGKSGISSGVKILSLTGNNVTSVFRVVCR
jgi:endoglucanase